MLRFGSTAPASSGAPAVPPRSKPRLGDAIKNRIDNAIGNLTGATDRIRALETHRDQLEGQLGNFQVMKAQNEAQIADLLAALQTCRTEVESGNALNAYMMHKLEDAEKKVVEIAEIEGRASKLIAEIFENQEAMEGCPPGYEAALTMQTTSSDTEMKARMAARVEKTSTPGAQATTVVHVHMHEPVQPARVELPRFVPVAKPPSPPKPMTALERMMQARDLKAADEAQKKQMEADQNYAVYLAHSAKTEADYKKREAEIADLRGKITANRMMFCLRVKEWYMELMAQKAEIELDTKMPPSVKEAALKAFPKITSLRQAAARWLTLEQVVDGRSRQVNDDFYRTIDNQNQKYIEELHKLGTNDSLYDFIGPMKFEEQDPELSNPVIRKMLGWSEEPAKSSSD